MQNKNEFLRELIPDIKSVTTNADIVAACPHVAVDATDLVVVGRYIAYSRDRIILTNNMMRDLQLESGEVKAAVINNIAETEYAITPINQIIGEKYGDMANRMLCITDAQEGYGAVGIVSPSVQHKAAELIGGNYYILLSSIHEALLVPVDGVSELAICSIHKAIYETAPITDRLTDAVYMYDCTRKSICAVDQDRQVTNIDIEKVDQASAAYRAYVNLQYGVFGEIIRAMSALQDGEIIRIVPTQKGGEENA